MAFVRSVSYVKRGKNVRTEIEALGHHKTEWHASLFIEEHTGFAFCGGEKFRENLASPSSSSTVAIDKVVVYE
jgi:hypothetical protein